MPVINDQLEMLRLVVYRILVPSKYQGYYEISPATSSFSCKDMRTLYV